MKRRKYMKLLAGLLCAAMLSANLMSTGILSLAAETVDVLGTETQMIENADAQEESFTNTDATLETGTVINTTQTQSSEIGEKNVETETNASTQKESASENAKIVENSAENITQPENTSEYVETLETETANTADVSENEIQEAETQVVLDADGNIASGVIDEDYGHITWVIDADGKLTVTGTGDFDAPESGGYPARVPWITYRKSIKSAKINVTNILNASYMFYAWSL